MELTFAMMDSKGQQKSAARERIAAALTQWLSEISADELLRSSHAQADFLEDLLPTAGVVASYKAKSNEASPEMLSQRESERSYAYPRVVGQDLEFYLVKSGDAWVKGPFGLLEPDPRKCERVPEQHIGAWIVPGVAFDRQGGRLGKGKGYYDRALSRSTAPKIGLCFSIQVSRDPLPREDHDVAMDFVVTETFSLQPLHHKQRNQKCQPS